MTINDQVALGVAMAERVLRREPLPEPGQADVNWHAHQQARMRDAISELADILIENWCYSRGDRIPVPASAAYPQSHARLMKAIDMAVEQEGLSWRLDVGERGAE
jgi:hypothetical protein